MSSPFPGMDPYLESADWDFGYDYALVYNRPVRPPLSDDDAAWSAALLQKLGRGAPS